MGPSLQMGRYTATILSIALAGMSLLTAPFVNVVLFLLAVVLMYKAWNSNTKPAIIMDFPVGFEAILTIIALSSAAYSLLAGVIGFTFNNELILTTHSLALFIFAFITVWKGKNWDWHILG